MKLKEVSKVEHKSNIFRKPFFHSLFKSALKNYNNKRYKP